MKTTLAILTLVFSLSLTTPPEVREGGITAPEAVQELGRVEAVKVAPKAEKAVETVKKAPEPPKPVASGSCELVYNYDWPQAIAHQICLYESGGNPNAANWSDNHMSWAGCMGSFGLMQINCSHGQLFDPVKNMAVAHSMYKSWGNSFRAWTTCAKVPGCS